MIIKASDVFIANYSRSWTKFDDTYQAKKAIKKNILTCLNASSFSFSASCGFDTIFSSLDMLVRDWEKQSPEISFRIVWIKDEDGKVIIDSISLKYLSL